MAGSMETNAAGQVVLRAAGTGLGLRRDQGFFAWQLENGDFDVAVQIESLSAPDLFGRVGLLARTSLEAESPFAGILATPTVAGVLFQSRQVTGAVGRQTGGALPSFPLLWVRLQRVGSTVTGATSRDGKRWFRLDTATLESASPLYVGVALTSWSANELAVAVVRDWSTPTGAIELPSTAPLELPGPSTRRTGLVVSEIMYHPLPRADGKDLEFVELFNAQSLFADLSGFRLSGELEYTIPEGTILRPGGFLVVARAPNDVRSHYGLTNVIGGYAPGLNNSSGVVRLLNRIGAVLLEAHYGSRAPWPAAADGAGHSLVLSRPSYGERNVRAWSASSEIDGSPGRWEYPPDDALSRVLINEVRSRSAPPGLDFIELYNHSPEPVDISGAFLSDTPTTNRFAIPSGTILSPGGFLVFDEAKLGFGLDASGEGVYFIAPDKRRVIDAIRAEPHRLGSSYGRSPNGAPQLRELSQATPGASNSAPATSEVVINEIMYSPLSGNDDDQYVELYNRGSTAVSVSGWQLTSGIRFTFPIGASIPAGGYLVVAKNAVRLRSQHPNLRAANCLGDFTGNLSGQGERLVLARPETVSLGGAGSETVWLEVCSVEYSSGGRWGRWSDGGGSSLELMDGRSDPTLAANWADSDETGNGEWTLVEHTGVLDNGNSFYQFNQFQILLEGVGECLLDNIEVIGPGGTNLLTNGDFENGLLGWTPQGSHRASNVEPGVGIAGSSCLHVRAESRGDPGANRIRATLPRGLAEGQTVTLRAQARWLRGFPKVLLRLRGNYLEAEGHLATRALGTPGWRNSRAVANAAPAVSDVMHEPVLPAAGQPVRVTARVADPDGLGQIVLRYRVDPLTELRDVPMRDDGTLGDLVAGDGVFSAEIPGQPGGVIVAFHLSATDADPNPATATFPAFAPGQECLIRVGENLQGGTFGTYRIWMTQATRNLWSSREKLNNAPLDVTFVNGQQRVVYNAESLYTGSPFVSSGYGGPMGSTLCGYAVHFPPDDPFLGATDMKLDWPVRDSSLQMEQVAYWIAGQMGLPSSHRRFVFLYVNGLKRGAIYEDAQQPNSDMVAQYFPDDNDGDLYKIDDWFEFDNAASSFSNIDATLQDFTTTGGEKKVARYRWNWRKRAVKQDASDYRSLFALVDATRDFGGDYVQAIDSLVDLEKYLGIVAMEHIVGNWDSFGYSRGKNMFTYKPQRGRWHLLPWDIDFVLGSGDGPDSSVYNTIDPTIWNLMFLPPFQRVYLRTLSDAANGPLQSARFGPVLNGNYLALLANGLTPASYGSGSNYLSRRMASIRQQLTDYTTSFSVAQSSNSITTEDRTFVLQGTAPVSVRSIQVNGIPYPVTWMDTTHWQMRLPLNSVSNRLQILALNSAGGTVGASRILQIKSTGQFEPPEGTVVINEIMYQPAVAGGEFVELHNNSVGQAFDLSGWQLSGLAYTFPAGTVLGPREYLIVARDRTAFWEAYGPEITPVGVFDVDLRPTGEPLRLLAPGSTPAEKQVISEVGYSDRLPWPTAARNGGVSLQLRNSRFDPSRVGHWGVRLPKEEEEWTLVSVSGPAASSHLLLYLSALPPVRDSSSIEGTWNAAIVFGQDRVEFQAEFRRSPAGKWEGDFVFGSGAQAQRSPWGTVGITNGVLVFGFSPEQPEFRFTMGTDPLIGSYQAPDQPSAPSTMTRWNPGGDVYLDDLRLSKGAVAAQGPNLLQDGGFEDPLASEWKVASNHSASAVSHEVGHSDHSSFHLIASTGGSTEANAVWREVPGLELGEVYTLSYWFRRGTNAIGLVARLGDWSLASISDVRPVEVKTSTPGEANSAVALEEELPRLWLNECDPVNSKGPMDRFGTRSPWVELFNAGTNSLSLSDFSLGKTLDASDRWHFPGTASIGAGQFRLIWLDGNATQSTEAEWHAGFRATPGTGTLTLWRQATAEPQIVDYLEYRDLPSGASIGWAEDGIAEQRWVFPQPTPALPNTALPSVSVLINEWMAANTRVLLDPADDDFEDWFELYNAGTRPADLSGFTLSDSLTDTKKFVIPPGTVIEPHAHLLVWADDEPEQREVGGEIHVNFKLSADGDHLLLSAPDGTQIDSVTFGPQAQDRSEGRWPDGAAAPFRRLTQATPGGRNEWSYTLRLAALRQSLDGQVEAYWASTAGQQFRVQFTEDLAEPIWEDYGPPLTAVGPEVQVVIEFPPVGHRFFRVILLDP